MKQTTSEMAAAITRAASKQTYSTIRFLVDRDRVADAFRAYAYFRWVDDILDAGPGSRPERLAFFERQKFLLDLCYQGRRPLDACPQERMLVELVGQDHETDSGLQLYLRNMMQVMEFDTRRRSRLISEAELESYTRWLSIAVMEAIHYFIGHDEFSPRDETRYLAVAAAHITHMLRDTFDDVHLGYYNIPQEVLSVNSMGPQDVKNELYRAWVQSRVLLARKYFKAGRNYFFKVENLRCRLACFAYIARFEWLLDTIERENYCLRPQYPERKSAGTGLRMSWLTLASLFHPRRARVVS